MKARAYSAGRVWLGSLVALTALALRVPTAEGQPGAPAGNSAASPQTQLAAGAQKAAPEQGATASISTADILKMVEAGVSQEVIRSFIENARTVSAPSPTDVIALKQHGVADEVTTALIKRSAETRAANAEAISRFLGHMRSPGGRLDPESYAYFQHYYLFPRTLSSAYERLYYGTPPYYYRPPPFGW